MNSEPGQASNISMTKMCRSGWTIHENGLKTNMYRIFAGGLGRCDPELAAGAAVGSRP
jgi:hypothetical protein